MQEKAFFTLHGATCADHDFRFGESAAAMLSALSPRELLDAVNERGESIVLAGVLSRSKLFFRELRRVLLALGDAEFVRRLVDARGLGGRSPLIAAANPHSLLIHASKVLTRHGNVGVIDASKGCQLDQLRELELELPVRWPFRDFMCAELRNHQIQMCVHVFFFFFCMLPRQM